jgi:hypothetical protein
MNLVPRTRMADRTRLRLGDRDCSPLDTATAERTALTSVGSSDLPILARDGAVICLSPLASGRLP